MWEIVLESDASGWQHKVLTRKATKVDRAEVVPFTRRQPDASGADDRPRFWWTCQDAAPSRTYLLALASADFIFAKVDFPEIEHLKNATYYQQLLDGNMPVKGSCSTLVDGTVIHIHFEAEPVLGDDRSGDRGRGRARGPGRGHAAAAGDRPARRFWRGACGRGRGRGRGGP